MTSPVCGEAPQGTPASGVAASLAKLGLAVGATLVTLFVCEFLVWLLVANPAKRIHFAVKSRGCCRLDPDLIWTFRPGTSGTWGNEEFSETMRINSLGLRGDEIGPKRDGETRVLAIGDSFTYGHGVQEHETYPAVLEALLRVSDDELRVLNGGQPGWSMDQTFRAFVTRRVDLRPDVVIVGVQCTDVVDDIEKSLYDLRGDTLIPLDARRNWIYLQGRVFDAIPRSIRKLKSTRLLVAALNGSDPFRQLPPLGESELRAWQRRKIILEVEEIARLGQARGYHTAVVLMPCLQDLEPPQWRIYEDLGEKLRPKVPLLEATAELRRREPDLARLFFPKDKHLNVVGNRALATAVADFLRIEGVVPGVPAAVRPAAGPGS